jgi:hypothetical protein
MRNPAISKAELVQSLDLMTDEQQRQGRAALWTFSQHR